jgi:uncharacterized protein YutE (UPF0331/DUF86 family)
MKPSVLKRLERFNKGLEILEELRHYDREEFSSDTRVLSIAERNLQVCTEFIINLSVIVYSVQALCRGS